MTSGKIMVSMLVLVSLLAGMAVWYLQVYGFYEEVARSIGIEDGVVSGAHPASASAAPLAVASAPSAATAPNEELLQAVQAATSLLKAYRTHGHLAAHHAGL